MKCGSKEKLSSSFVTHSEPANRWVAAAMEVLDSEDRRLDKEKAESTEGKALKNSINSGEIKDIKRFKDFVAQEHYDQAYNKMIEISKGEIHSEVDRLEKLSLSESIFRELMFLNCYGKEKFLKGLEGDKLRVLLFSIANPETFEILLEDSKISTVDTVYNGTNLLAKILERLKICNKTENVSGIVMENLKTFGELIIEYLQAVSEEHHKLSEEGWSPFYIAVITGDVDQIRFFLEIGMDPNESTLKYPATPMQAALGSLMDAIKEANKLFEKEWGVMNAVAEKVVAEKVAVCKIFLDHLSDGEIETDPLLFLITDLNSRNVLHYLGCLGEGAATAVGTFIRLGAEVNHRDDSGNTPLHYAVLEDNSALVGSLLAAGGNPRIFNNKKESAFDLATGDIRSCIEEFLESPSEASYDSFQGIPVSPQDIEEAIVSMSSGSGIGVVGGGPADLEEHAQSDDSDDSDDDDQDGSSDRSDQGSGGESDSVEKGDLSEDHIPSHLVKNPFISLDADLLELDVCEKKYSLSESKEEKEREESIREIEERSFFVSQQNKNETDFLSDQIEMDIVYIPNNIGMKMVGQDLGVGLMTSILS